MMPLFVDPIAASYGDNEALAQKMAKDFEAEQQAANKKLIAELSTGGAASGCITRASKAEQDAASAKLLAKMGDTRHSGHSNEPDEIFLHPMEVHEREAQKQLSKMSDPSRFPTRVWTKEDQIKSPKAIKEKALKTENYKNILYILVTVNEIMRVCWDPNHKDFEKYDVNPHREKVGDSTYCNREPTSALRGHRKKLRKLLKERNGERNRGGGGLGGMFKRSPKKYANEEFASKTKPSLPSANEDSPENICKVCEAEFEVGDEIRTLPCLHSFHSQRCIDAWLRTSDKCPVCQKKCQHLGLRLDVQNSWDYADNLAKDGRLVGNGLGCLD
jgi:hypothetical protein